MVLNRERLLGLKQNVMNRIFKVRSVGETVKMPEQTPERKEIFLVRKVDI
jgi:hypothetical protein